LEHRSDTNDGNGPPADAAKQVSFADDRQLATPARGALRSIANSAFPIMRR
jgi:hypothetical protein